jgi:hypothetical protein
MSQEDKKLLLKDLCARLPYGVMLNTPIGNKVLLALVFSKKYNTIIEYNDYHGNENDISEWEGGDIEFVKPYLRPMSSMTEEERKEIGILIRENRPNPYGIINNKGVDNLLFSVSVTSRLLIDWLNAHHFDYRGLIEKGLAIAVTKDNNPYEN